MNNTDIVNIIPNLYISNWYTAENFDILEKYNIKAIITLETRPKSSYVLDYYNRHNIDFKYIFIEDSVDADISKYFDVTYDFIKSHISKGDNVLVHCYAGISRSSSIILNYMIRFIYESGKSVIDNPRSVVFNALSYSRSKRPFINPNPGFIEQLIEKSVEYSKNINKKGGSKLQDMDNNNILYDDYNYLYDKGDKNIIELYNKGKRIGKKWSEKQINIITVTSPRPTVNPSIFNHYNNIN